MKNAKHLKAIPLKKWILFYAPRDEQLAYEFSVNLNKVARSMNLFIDEPEAYALLSDLKLIFYF